MWATHPAVEFNGTTSSITCGSASTLDDLHDGAFTVEGWVAFDNIGEGGFGRIFDKGSHWAFYASTPAAQTGIRLTGLIDCVTTDAVGLSTESIDASRWVHVAMTWDDATYTKPRLWLMGVELTNTGTGSANRNGAIVSDAADVLYRGNRAAGDRAFDGKQGWVRISNVVRYTGPFGVPDRFMPPAVDANTVLLHRTDEGSGTALADAAGNGAGTASNLSWVTQSQGEVASVYSAITATNTTNAGTASRLPHQRSTFYAKGRHWLFYGDYDAATGPYDLYFTSSTDGLTWATPTNLTTFPIADAQWSVHYDAAFDKLHIAKNIQNTGSPGPFHDGLSYRVGTPQTDGTITWLDTWQTAIATGTGVGDVSLTTDTDGHVWVGYGDGDTLSVADGTARAIKNANTDGTWSTAAGFPTAVHAGVTDDAFVILCPLSGGDMYGLVYEWNVDDEGIGYLIEADGTVTLDTATATLTAIETATGTGAKVARVEIDSTVDGVVHLVYQDTSQNIKYRTRDAGGTWSSETTLSDNTRVTDTISSPRLSFGRSGEVYVMWSATNAIYCTQNLGSGWETPVLTMAQTAENTYEHLMPAHRAHGVRLPFTRLTSSYGLWFTTAWVGKLQRGHGPLIAGMRNSVVL